MKVQKNKIVFVLLMACAVLFITVYSVLTFGKDNKEEMDADDIPLPDLEDTSVEYESKLEAIDAIKEEKQRTAPSLYPEHMVDDKGYFNPDYMEFEKQRIIDSIYQSRSMKVVEGRRGRAEQVNVEPVEIHSVNSKDTNSTSIQELGLAHQLFFASHAQQDVSLVGLAYVDGNQTVKDGHRLALRLERGLDWDGHYYPSGTRIYGFVKIRPNRVLLDIVKLGANEVRFKAYDLQDGQEGIYVENQLQGEVLESGVDATLGDINIPGIPQVSGIKRIFQRNNRSIKVAIQHQYQIKIIQVP